MSDNRRILCLPKRYIPRVGLCKDEWVSVPDAFDLTQLGELHYSGIATNAKMGFFQDNISKQVFWSEYDSNNAYPMQEEGEQFGLWYVEPEQAERDELHCHIFGWGFELYGSVSYDERVELKNAVTDALKDSPTEEQIDSIVRHYRYKEPFTPWWSEK